jgi:DNA-binding SARP family transcriptional activator
LDGEDDGPCHVVPLRAPGGALVSSRAWRSDLRRLRAADGLGLSALGALACTLDPSDVSRSLACALEALRWSAGADDAELFLAEPVHRELLMVACRGDDRQALQQRVRFLPGAGYPGAAVQHTRAYATRKLSVDRRFLRDRVKQSGVRSYVCVPIVNHGAPIGALALAWHRTDVPIERVLCFLERIAPVVSGTVEAGLSFARDAVRKAMQAPSAERKRALMETLARIAHARAVHLASRGADPASCDEVCDECLPKCSFVGAGRARVLGSVRARWPRRCRALPIAIEAPCCLPALSSDETQRPLAILDYGSAPPSPPTRDLVVLLHMVQESALSLDARAPASAACVQRELRLKCLGEFELSFGDLPVERAAFKRKHAITLLRLLVLRGGAAVDGGTLAELIWPGTDERSAANRLHGVVHALRSAIEPRATGGIWSFIKTQGELYYFDTRSPHWVDLYEFRIRLASSAVAERENRDDDAIDALARAIELYRGDLFADAIDPAYFLAHRTECRQRLIAACVRIAALLRSRHELDAAAQYLERALAADVLREDVHQLLMAVLLEAGRRHDARDRFSRCAQVLRSELGSEPLAMTRELGRRAGHPDA